MKIYPKVPRHDLEFVPDELFESDDLVLIEKVDGMNFRFTLYEERFRSEYSDEVLNQSPDDGDIVFGTKSVVRGCLEEPIDSYPSELHTGIKSLKNDVDNEKISAYQDELGPLTWFAENMVPHTLDYNYEDDPPPILIGFDVYIPRQDDRVSEDFNPNPYKEEFIGYVDYGTAMNMFINIGLERTPLIDSAENTTFDAESFEVPTSEFADVQAEGVVIRSDSLQLRSKYVRESFREMNKSGMGANSNKNEEPEQWILDYTVTPARIRKTIRKAVRNDGLNFSTDGEFIDLVSERVLHDAWKEEFGEIRQIGDPVKPSNIHDDTYEKVEAVAERMKQMSARTGDEPEDTWMMLDEPVNSDKVLTNRFNQSEILEIETTVSREIRDNNTSIEEALVREIIGFEQVREVVNNELKDKDIKSDLVTSSTDRATDLFWTNNVSQDVLWRLHLEFNPANIREVIMEEVKNHIEEKTGEDLDKGGETWKPDGDYSMEGFDSF